MGYFTQEFNDFFQGLSRNNKREWFHAHKKEYEAHVKRPFYDFVEEMIHRVGALDPRIATAPKDAVFRIARDIRFSKDKTPYKTYVAAAITPGGRKDIQYPGLYFSFGAHGVGIAGGMYQPDKDNLLKIRQAIAADGAVLMRALRGKRFQKLFGELQGEENKRIPKELMAAVDKYPLIMKKQFYYYASYDSLKTVLRNDLAQFVMDHHRAGQKVREFLQQALAA